MSDNSDTNNPTAISLMIILSILGGFSFETITKDINCKKLPIILSTARKIPFNCFDVS